MSENKEGEWEREAAAGLTALRRRHAEFISHPNLLKAKVGSGGLGEEILEKAQALLENNSVDFQPLGEMYLDSLMKGISLSRNSGEGDDLEAVIASMLYPAMQLKANGGMFHYPLITTIAGKLVQFLELIQVPDEDVVEIVLAFHTAMRAVIHGKVSGTGGVHGQELAKALDQACERYFEKHPDNCIGESQNYNFDL